VSVTDHQYVAGLLGAWALGACPPRDAAVVTAHLAGCPACRAEATRLRRAAGLLGTQPAHRHGSRQAVLRAALARRPAAIPAAAAPYAAQVRRLDELLASLPPRDWDRAVVHGWSVAEMVAHLHWLDAVLAAQLAVAGADPADPAGSGRAGPGSGGGPAPEELRTAWRAQAAALVDAVRTAGGTALLDQPVELAGQTLPVRAALLQRAFETWIHGDDIRLALTVQPFPPAPEHLFVLAAAGVRLLVHAAGVRYPAYAGRTVEVALSGDGGGTWTLPLGPAGVPPRAPARAAATVRLDVLEFCYLLGGRRDPDRVPYRATGDRRLVRDLLTVAAALDRDQEIVGGGRGVPPGHG
jgi:uncharacterized protein (TIGR03083 family)